jgi:tripartite-type tricarboxylate transporter receptor subunit TctC
MSTIDHGLESSTLPGRRTILAGLLLSLAAPAAFAQASAYPAKPVRLVVAYAAGGGTDVAARIVAEALSRELGQQVFVENKVGASGNIGGTYVAKAPADGYTLLFGAMANLAINPHLYKDMPYVPEKDFAPIGKVFDTSHVIVASPTSEIKSFESLVKLGRQNPKKYTYASAGAGSSTHIVAELFAHATGMQLVHIPYKGNGPALIDVIGGQVDLMFDQVPNSAPHVATGKVRALAVMSRGRLDSMPAVPTVTELGFPQVVASSWTGLFAPADTPAVVVETLNRAMAKVLAAPETRQKLDKVGAVAGHSSPAEMAKLLADDSRRFGDLIRRAGIKAE